MKALINCSPSTNIIKVPEGALAHSEVSDCAHLCSGETMETLEALI